MHQYPWNIPEIQAGVSYKMMFKICLQPKPMIPWYPMLHFIIPLSHDARKRAREGEIHQRLSLELQVPQTRRPQAPGRRHGRRGDAQGFAAPGARGAVEGVPRRGGGLPPVLAAAGHAAEGEALGELGRGTGAATQGQPRGAGAGPGETAEGQAAHEVLMRQRAGWTVIFGWDPAAVSPNRFADWTWIILDPRKS